MTTKNIRGRGRPRKFDVGQGVATALGLFHERGYDAVSVADLTEALGINTPSFYAAYGSKSALFERVLDLYADTGALPLCEILAPGRPPEEALVSLLREAAERYSADQGAPGCLVLEASRCGDAVVRGLAGAGAAATGEAIRRYLASTHPHAAERGADYVLTTMVGLSAAARAGMGRERLLAVAEMAGRGAVAALGAADQDTARA